jgi:hypothetical protein
LDANVLLNVYRIGDATRTELLRTLEQRRGKIWVPYQFALEYQRRRLRVIAEQAAKYGSAAEHTSKLIDDFESDRAPFVTAESLDALHRIRKELEVQRENTFALLTEDPHLNSLSSLLDGCVGGPPDAEENSKLLAQARQRIADGIPPGGRDVWKAKRGRTKTKADENRDPGDAKKDARTQQKETMPDEAAPKSESGRVATANESDDVNMFGDCLGWLQILAHAKSEKAPCLLITDDRKDDWWESEGGRRIGPLPALIREFREACGQRFHMYLPSRFLQWASERGNVPVLNETIEELEHLEQRDGVKTSADLEKASDESHEGSQASSVERVRKGD